MSVKFTPGDFLYKILCYFIIELTGILFIIYIIVDSFKYISIFHLNKVSLDVLN